MDRTTDDLPFRLLLLVQYLRFRGWASTQPVEWGGAAGAVGVVVVRLVGEEWWVAALCGFMLGIVAVLLIPPVTRRDS
ncbi:hypothetical protein [Lentzea sp. NPDC059081]|uniref:hypothetical protein n=1 Tax=Lentzea sp. NPDC059081 TaxID=3346719 RepID=UPI0036AC1684